MKKWVALLGGAMFIVLFLSMYMVVDQLGKSPSYKELIDMQVNVGLVVVNVTKGDILGHEIYRLAHNKIAQNLMKMV